MKYFFEYICVSFRLIIPVLLIIAFYTLLERKIIRSVQRRRGPTELGLWGLIQAIADGRKLLFKETLVILEIYRFLFFRTSVFILVLSLRNWRFRPFYISRFLDTQYSMLGFLRFSSLSVYGLIFAGWASNSRYPFLGGIRAAAQLISYELVLTFIVLMVRIVIGSFNFFECIEFQEQQGWLLWALLPLFFIFIIVILAETNRTPFDLPEAEAELVAGYNLEYSSISFAFFFLREYSNILLISFFFVCLFMGGWFFLELKVLIVRIFFICIRARLPRFRYDQLIILGWGVLLPIVLGYGIFLYIICLII